MLHISAMAATRPNGNTSMVPVAVMVATPTAQEGSSVLHFRSLALKGRLREEGRGFLFGGQEVERQRGRRDREVEGDPVQRKPEIRFGGVNLLTS